ncbi:tRNA pseudouridine(38-40) synthase TruA [Pseudochrobactrum sp. MP213Fo]|uniref:tRNA pseudouridine(38-40) synthase TruA n=1 Tax=Pseudochrobactrum sp. MP213Fo TaxID=3022250 RepID=UPI003B9DDAEC
MPRYRLTIEYDGTPYCGWQRQDNATSVQQTIETAVFKFCGEHTAIGAAGRTDSGVHAFGQTAHLDLSKDWSATKVRDALNAHLLAAEETVYILNVEKVPDRFDARFSALGRHYLYRIVNRRTPLALEANRAWWVSKRLDADVMQEAAQLLIGTHDFTTFRSSQCQSKSPVKTLARLDVTRCGELIEVRASARSFLHNQVRSLVGSIADVGCGRWSHDDLLAALAKRDRKACGVVAPAHGLYMIGADYSPIL